MIEKINKSKEKIIIVLFFVNLIIFILSFFTFSKLILIINTLINLIFLGTYYIINKFGFMIDTISVTNKLANNFFGDK